MAEISLVAGAVRCSLGADLEAVGRALIDGQSGAQTLTLDDFPARDFPYYPLPDLQKSGETDATARLQQVLESCAGEALAGAGIEAESRQQVGLFLGSSSFAVGAAEQRYRQALADDLSAIPLPNYRYGDLARDLRQLLGLAGGEFTLSTACTSSANALLQAQRAVRAGCFPAALVVGTELFNRTTLLGFDSLQLLSRSGYRPFDRQRSGMVLGEGVAAVVIADPARLPLNGMWQGLTLRGGASGCDPNGITCSSAESMARVVAQALDGAGMSPAQLALIKGHGSGSESNDAAEAAAMQQVFGSQQPPLTAIKGALGHTLGACGVLELAVLAAALQQGRVPPTLGFAELDPGLGCTPLITAEPFGGGTVMLNYFGFGGNNTSLLLEVAKV